MQPLLVFLQHGDVFFLWPAHYLGVPRHSEQVINKVGTILALSHQVGDECLIDLLYGFVQLAVYDNPRENSPGFFKRISLYERWPKYNFAVNVDRSPAHATA